MSEERDNREVEDGFGRAKAMNLLDLPSDEFARRLQRAQIGSCTCDTKTPELKYHTELCHYRLFSEAEKLTALIPYFKASEGTPLTDALIETHSYATPEDFAKAYLSATNHARTLETTKNILAAELAKAVDDYGVAQHAREHLRGELARVRAEERERLIKIVANRQEQYFYEHGHVESDTNAGVFNSRESESYDGALQDVLDDFRALPPTEGKKAAKERDDI